MANWWAVNEAGEMLVLRDDDTKARHSLGDGQMWCEVPGGVAVGNVKVSGSWPDYTLIDGAADKAGPLWDALRAERNIKLSATDWTQAADVQTSVAILSAQAKTDWADYRQALRDLPQNTSDPEDATWPVAP